jgi:hypothetical protein
MTRASILWLVCSTRRTGRGSRGRRGHLARGEEGLVEEQPWTTRRTKVA